MERAIIEVKHISIMNVFLTNMQVFSSQDSNWWTGVVWIFVMFLSAVWTLILTAPIHCKGFIDEQVMQCYISPNLFWWTLLLLGWPESEDILICGWIMPFRVWTLCFLRSVSVFELFWDSFFMLVLFCVRQAMATGCDHLILLNRCFVHNRRNKVIQIWDEGE